MKYLLFTILLIPTLVFAQTPDVQMEEEKTKTGVIIYLINNLEDQKVEAVLDLTSEGFGLKPKESFNVTVGPKSKEKIVELVGKSNTKYSYASSLSYKTIPLNPVTQRSVTTRTKTTTKQEIAKSNPPQTKKAASQQTSAEKTHPLKGKKGIVVYSKEGCGRCHFVTDYLKKNNIPFEDLNITKDKAADRQMSTVLFASGFKGGSFTTPLITVDDQAHYNIKDLKGFLAKLNK